MKLKLPKLPRKRLAIISAIGVLLAAGLFFVLRWLRDTGILFSLIGVPAFRGPCSGVIMAPSIVSTSITPADKLYIGDHLHVTALVGTMPKQGKVRLISNTKHSFAMYDDGSNGDAVADDQNWTLDLTWEESYGTGKQRLRVQMQWPGNVPAVGPETELTILKRVAENSSCHPAAEPK